MSRTALRDKRARLVDTAARLVHEQGFDRTTLADIARESGVPLGNVYYYFKTKEAIGEALVDKLAGTSAVLRETWDARSDPRARLEAFIDTTIANRESLARCGCPIGSLCAELHKENGPVAQQAATLFRDLLTWIEAQFRSLGRGRESRDLAVHLLSALQGASLLAHTFHDPRYVVRESNGLKAWVRSLPAVETA